MNPHVHPRGNKRIHGTTKEETEAKARARARSQLTQEEDEYAEKPVQCPDPHVVLIRGEVEAAELKI